MKLLACAQALSKLREGRVWLLLASNDSVTTLALLNDLFLQNPEDRVLPQSVLLERLSLGLDDLRAQGFELPQSPQSCIQYWRTRGWLSRVLQPGASEEEYSLTADAATAVRLILNLYQPRSFATESRLASVMHQVAQLKEATDANPATRLAALQAEKARIEADIAQIEQGEVRTLSDDRALERAREILQQAHELADDFQNVRAAFERLNQDLRTSLLEVESSRFETLRAMFDGMDRIKQSEPGRTFEAFWRLLNDVEQSSALEESLDQLLDRPFSNQLASSERRFLNRLPQRLTAEADSVQRVIRVLGQSLNRFVCHASPDARQRINEVLQQAKLAALGLKDTVGPRTALPFALSQSVPQIRSVAQYQLRDPQQSAPAAPIAQAQESTFSLEALQALIAESEIDLKTLMRNIRDALTRTEQTSIQALLTEYPVPQGLGTVIGYVHLGAMHGRIAADTQLVSWVGRDDVLRHAQLPLITFTAAQLPA